MLSRRGLITGLVSFLAAPAIVRVASLDLVRGVPLEMERELMFGYTITRQAVENRLYDLVRLKAEGASIEYDRLTDTATVWCDPDFAGLHEWP